MIYLLNYQNEEKNYKIIKTNVSSQIVTTNEQAISGTEISYTPTQNAIKVAYKFQIQYHDDPTSNTILGSMFDNYIYIQFKRNSGSGYTNLEKGFRINENENYARTQGVYKGKFKIDTWSGSQNFKMSAIAQSANKIVTLHLDEASNVHHPIIKMYSIM